MSIRRRHALAGLLAPAAMLLASPALAQVGADDPCPPESGVCGCGKQHALRLRAQAGLPVAEPGAPGYDAREALTDTDVISCDLDMEIVPSTSVISGVCTMVVESEVAGLSQFTIVLRSNYTVTGATINGSTAVTVPAPTGNSYRRTIQLDRAYGVGERFTLRIPYSGTAVSRGFGSISFGTQPGSSNPIVASLSEAYYAATWWPCKDGDVFLAGDNSDKFTMRLAVTAPDTLTSVANGPLQSVTTVPGGKKKYVYASNYPIATYLVAFASSVYNTWSTTYTYVPDGGGAARTMPLNFFIYPGSDTAANRAAWERVGQMMDAYRPFFGLYPFINEQYGIYQFPFGGGMEHQTLTGQGTFNESVTAHELGHQWWGDNVTCRTWSDIWLNEGFATYSEAIWAQYKPGSAGQSALFAAMAARKPSNPGDSVYVYNVADMNRIFSSAYTYNKGAWVLHQLRRIMGDDAFFAGLREYRARFQGAAATTVDFAAAMSFVAGRDLSNYFQQWVMGVGAPDFAIGWRNIAIGGRPFLMLRLRQTHNATWPGTGVPGDAFAMPVDIRITTASGATTRRVEAAARSQHFLIPLDAAATDVAVDPDNWILSYAKVSEAYVDGPAKVVATSPAPGATLLAAPPTFTIGYSEPVTVPAGAITVTGPGGVAVPATHAYDGAAMRSTLSFASPLGAGVYTVRVPATVMTVSSGLGLDGEVAAGVLPSGDGLAGGDAVVAFTVSLPPCPADYNADGGVDGGDVESFFRDWEAGEAAADVNADGGVDGGDLSTFFAAWQAGGC
ncbi:MAG: M1 family aminopeptidase [Phycisphaerae bacterium]